MKLHTKILLCIFLLGNSCNEKQKNIDLLDGLFDKREINNIEEEAVKESTCLDKKWMEEVSIRINSNFDCLKVLKVFVKQYGLRLNILASEYNGCIEYEATDKKLIDIISDILEMLNLKIIINGKNGIISEDSMYIHNYTLKNLPGIQNKNISTVVEHNFGSNTGNVMKNEYTNDFNYYNELNKNLNLLICGDEENCKFSINKQSGIISVIATQKIHKRISKYFQSISKFLNDEILVEANIIEVILRDRFGVGINWSGFGDVFKVAKDGFLYKREETLNRVKNECINAVCSQPVLFFSEKNLDADKSFLDILSYYGKVSSVSNPKLVVANNSAGTFKAIENYIYFDFKLNKHENRGRNNDDSGVDVNKNAEIKTAVVGVIFTVHVLKLEDGRIKLYVKPTITDVNGHIPHDGYKYVMGNEAVNGHVPTIPRLKTRELETTFTMNNNQTVVIGGLITEKEVEECNPKIGFFSMFKNTSNKKVFKKSELVIVLKVKALEHPKFYDEYEVYFEQ